MVDINTKYTQINQNSQLSPPHNSNSHPENMTHSYVICHEEKKLCFTLDRDHLQFNIFFNMGDIKNRILC